MKADSPLETRIRSIRRAVRARLPLQERIDLVRARHRALLEKNGRSNSVSGPAGRYETGR